MKPYRLFIAYQYMPTHPRPGAFTFGMGQLDVEVDFPIRNGDDLTRALRKGFNEHPKEKKVHGMSVVVMNWKRFEE